MRDNLKFYSLIICPHTVIVQCNLIGVNSNVLNQKFCAIKYIFSEDHVIIDVIPQSITADIEVLHMGSVEGLPHTGGTDTTNYQWVDILHTVG